MYSIVMPRRFVIDHDPSKNSSNNSMQANNHNAAMQHLPWLVAARQRQMDQEEQALLLLQSRIRHERFLLQEQVALEVSLRQQQQENRRMFPLLHPPAPMSLWLDRPSPPLSRQAASAAAAPYYSDLVTSNPGLSSLSTLAAVAQASTPMDGRGGPPPPTTSSTGNQDGASLKRVSDHTSSSTSTKPHQTADPRPFRKRPGVTEPFPDRLHRLLREAAQNGQDSIASFLPNSGFHIHDPEAFANQLLPLYFKQSRLASFQRQLNGYGFARLKSGQPGMVYAHPFFQRDRPELCEKMERRK